MQSTKSAETAPFHITVWHGESGSLFYVVDTRCDVVVAVSRTRADAEYLLWQLTGETATAITPEPHFSMELTQ